MKSSRLEQIILARSINQLSQAEIDRLLALNLIDPNSDISRKRKAELAEVRLRAILLLERIMLELQLAFEETLKEKRKTMPHLCDQWLLQTNYYAMLLLEARISAERRLFHLRGIVEKKIGFLLAIIEQKIEELDARLAVLDRTVKFLQKIYREEAATIVESMLHGLNNLNVPQSYKQFVKDRLTVVFDGFLQGLVDPDEFPGYVRKMINGSARFYVDQMGGGNPLVRRQYPVDIQSHQTTILKKMNEIMVEEEWRFDLMRENLEAQGIGLARRAAVHEEREALIEHKQAAEALRELAGDDAKFRGYISVDVALTQMKEIAHSLDELAKKVEGIQPHFPPAADEKMPERIRIRESELKVSDNVFSLFNPAKIKKVTVAANDHQLGDGVAPKEEKLDNRKSAHIIAVYPKQAPDLQVNPSPPWVSYRAPALMDAPANDKVLVKSPAEKIKELREKLATKRMKAESALRALEQPVSVAVNDRDMAFGF